MKVIKKNSTEFSKIIKNSNQAISHSFFENAKNLDEDQLKVIAKCIGENITHNYELASRILYVTFTNPHTFEIKITENINSRKAIFDLYIIQSTTRMYLVVASKFDIYEFLERDPYHESLGEYSYQTELAKALGIMNAVAYNIPRNHQLNENIVTDEDLELLYCSDDNQFFLIYGL